MVSTLILALLVSILLISRRWWNFTFRFGVLILAVVVILLLGFRLIRNNEPLSGVAAFYNEINDSSFSELHLAVRLQTGVTLRSDTSESCVERSNRLGFGICGGLRGDSGRMAKKKT